MFTIPSLCHHRASGRAYVKIRGKAIYLGEFGSDESLRRYKQVIADFLLADERSGQLTVKELAAQFLASDAATYTKNGRPTTEVGLLKFATNYLVAEHGESLVDRFGPRQLREVTQTMVDAKLSRTTCNKYLARIKRVFRWGVESELVDPTVFHALQAVRPLRRGRTVARETEPIRPVLWSHVEAILPYVQRPVRGLILVQWWSGCRPGEACRMRWCDIETSTDIWTY